MGLLKSSLPEDFSVMVGDEIEPEMVLDDDLPTYTDQAVNVLISALETLESLGADKLTYYHNEISDAHARLQSLSVHVLASRWNAPF